MKTPHNPFKAALRDGKQQLGFWLGLCNPLSAELLGHTGYDWLLIDGEHAPNNTQSILAQLQAIGNTPAHPVVRLVDDNPAAIKQALDIGVQSLLIPMVETAEQTTALVAATRYPPNGTRGVGTALARAASWNMCDDYFESVEQEFCLLIQIESVKGVENLDAILAVDRIDGVFIGPADLAASLGHLNNPGHPDVVCVIAETIAKIRAAGLAAGTLATNKPVARARAEQGVQFIALGVDTLALAQKAKSVLADFHSEEDGKAEDSGNGAY